MNCACHDQPAYWVKSPRYTAGGYWECREKRRRYNYQRATSPAGRAKRRQRDLLLQRADVLDKLSHLQEEARLLGA